MSNKENYYNQYPSSYSTLSCQYKHPLFTPCIAKRCALGPYMYSGDPTLERECQNVSNYDMAQVACGKAFKGRPVHFEYTAISDDSWRNKLCNTATEHSLCVL